MLHTVLVVNNLFLEDYSISVVTCSSSCLNTLFTLSISLKGIRQHTPGNFASPLCIFNNLKTVFHAPKRCITIFRDVEVTEIDFGISVYYIEDFGQSIAPEHTRGQFFEIYFNLDIDFNESELGIDTAVTLVPI